MTVEKNLKTEEFITELSQVRCQTTCIYSIISYVICVTNQQAGSNQQSAKITVLIL